MSMSILIKDVKRTRSVPINLEGICHSVFPQKVSKLDLAKSPQDQAHLPEVDPQTNYFQFLSEQKLIENTFSFYKMLNMK